MKKCICFFILFLLTAVSAAFATDQKTVAEEQIKKKAAPLEQPAKEKLFLSTDYDYGWVHLGSQTGSWTVFTNTVAYEMNKFFTPYLEQNVLGRFGHIDYSTNVGSYLKFQDSSYIHSEIGFGENITYIYNFQATLEYVHKLIDKCFWLAGSKYLNYRAGSDVYIVYPGLIYYFGDSYITAFYDNSFTEGRGMAKWGSVKGNFALTDRLSAWLGAAYGQRMYDIELLPSSQQYGYIAFCGLNYKITEWLSAKSGFSYSREKPDFIKRSLEAGLTCKF